MACLAELCVDEARLLRLRLLALVLVLASVLFRCSAGRDSAISEASKTGSVQLDHQQTR